MGLALETVVGYVASLTGTPTYDPFTPNPNQSFTVRAYQDGTSAYLEDVWATGSTEEILVSIKSPRLHDDVRGILLIANVEALGGVAEYNPQTLLPGYITQKLFSTDILSVTATGTAADTAVVVFNVRYENLGGVNARLFHWNEISGQIANIVGIQVAPTASATAGLLGTPVALNSIDARLKANTDYALLGYQTGIPITAIVVNGVDLGNLNVGGPGDWDQDDVGDFFIEKSVKYNTAHIPVINSNNAGGTTVAIADVFGATAPNITLILGELKNRMGSPSTP